MVKILDVYKEYISSKKLKGKDRITASKIAEGFGITRDKLYDIVNLVEKGDANKIRLCTDKSRLECLWEYKYKLKYKAIPNNRKKESIVRLSSLIKEMRADKFSMVEIGRFCGKDHSTIHHHLNKI